MTDKEKIRREIEKRYEYWREKEHNSHSIESEIRMSECQHLLLLFNSLQEEPVSKDLEEAAKHHLYSNILYDDVYVGNPTDKDCIEMFKAGAQWQKEHLWKDAQGDDLPEIDKEVIALIEAFGHYKVIFAHRVDENAEIHTSIDGKPLVLHPKRHDKGGWNIHDVKWWLDLELPKIKE